jgi:hypothetical protein
MYGLHVKYLLFLSDVNKSRIFSADFSKNTQILHFINFMKIRPVGAELFHADGRIDRHDEANSRYSQFFEGAQKFLGQFWRNMAIHAQLQTKVRLSSP